MIIRGEKVVEAATLSPSRELLFASSSDSFPSFLEESCQKAYAHGEEQGEKLGYMRALEEIKSLMHLLQNLSHKILEYKQHLLEKLKPEVVEFSLAVCEQVIRKELSHPDTFAKLIGSLLSIATASSMREESLLLILSSEDLSLLESHLQYHKKDFVDIKFRVDPLMKRGDCRIETPTGLLNHSISRQLADLQSKVLQG